MQPSHWLRRISTDTENSLVFMTKQIFMFGELPLRKMHTKHVGKSGCTDKLQWFPPKNRATDDFNFLFPLSVLSKFLQ